MCVCVCVCLDPCWTQRGSPVSCSSGTNQHLLQVPFILMLGGVRGKEWVEGGGGGWAVDQEGMRGAAFISSSAFIKDLIHKTHLPAK